MDEINIQGSDIIVLSIFVLWVGNWITQRIGLLKKYSIPVAVTGGIICSVVVAIIESSGGPDIKFDMTIRDSLLMVFFSTIGLSAKLDRLKSGGKALGILVLCAVFLVIQNVTGVLIAKAYGVHPGYGLFAGSISLAGGHGTAIAWGQEAAAAGLQGAEIAGIAFATFGLVAGGIIGGPVSDFLIRKNELQPSQTNSGELNDNEKDIGSVDRPFIQGAFFVLLVLAVCLSLGDIVNRFLFSNNIKLPGFLTAMLVGILITNIADKRGRPLPEEDFNHMGEVSLQLFLAMSLMSMDLLSISEAFGPIFVTLCIQVSVITLFAVFVVFRVMGKDYDAAVICGGFCGLGMGATPVAIANMNATTQKYGPSFKAFLVIPLVGAFFVDLLNAVIIKFFIGLPMLQKAVDA